MNFDRFKNNRNISFRIIWAIIVIGAGGVPAGYGQPYGLSGRGSVGPYLNGAMPAVAPVTAGSWTTVNAFPNLNFQDPTFLTAEPGSNLLFVCGREGQIWSFTNAPNTSTKTLVLDLSAHCQGWNDCGLLGMAFHPQFGQAGSPNRGYIYVYYSYTPGPIVGSYAAPPDNYSTPSYNRLSRFTIPDGSTVADPNSELVLINQFDRDLWHDGGAMFFGPDGFLYLTNGDEGGAGDEYNQSQKINSGLFGGVLRIDVDQNPALSHPIRRQPQSGGPPPAGWPATYSANYSIPNDNPWLDPNGGNLEEFWAIGFRSPHRMTQDRVTGQIWLGDVGQAAWEEVDLIQKGGNYQWAYLEGLHPGFKPMPSPLIGTDTPPVYNYSHDSGDTCVIGGYVYRGTQLAAQLGGQYIYGDNTSNRIYSLVLNGSSAPTVTYLASLPPGSDYTGGISTFGEDANHELYMCTMGLSGSIYKLQIAGQSTAAIPALLSQTGAFADLASLTPAIGVIPYTVNVPFWSDGAVKSRWIAVPTNAPIGFHPTGEWSFPPGTVFIKHFELGTDDTNPAVQKRLETRLIVVAADGSVYGVTYKWRADNSDADLLTGSLSEDIPIATASGTRIQSWYYPSGQDCLTCHNPNANYILGVKTRQLNGSFTYPSTGIADNQLRTLNHLGLFTPALNESDIPGYASLASVSNLSASLETRTRSYLDANCAQCHRPSGVQSYWDARFDTPLANQGIIDGPLVSNLGIPNATVLTPGSLATSMLYLRTNITGTNQMPTLARSTVDEQDVSLLISYIDSLPVLLTASAGPDQGVVPGSLVTLQGSASNIPANTAASYSWSQVIGPQVTLANASTLTPSFTPPSAGTFAFALTVTAGSSKGTSDPVTITAGPLSAPSLSTLPADLTVSAGETAILTMAMAGIPLPSVQWMKNGQPISGATQTIVILPNVQLGDAGTYSVMATNSLGSSTTNGETLIVNAPVAISAQPQSLSAAAGSLVTLSVTATGSGPLSYQWYRNGVAVAGAVYSTYTISSAQGSDAGSYSVTVGNAASSANSSVTQLTISGSSGTPGYLVNLSGRAVAGAASQTLTAGFVVGGLGSEPLLIRGIGPTLAQFGVSGFLPNAQLQVVTAAEAVVAQDANWGDSANASQIAATAQELGAFALPAGSLDAAVLTSLSPGAYTAQVTGVGGATGVGLVEVYAASLPPNSGVSTPIVNFSIRAQVGTGSGILIAGFVIGGTQAETLLIRGVGPTLAQFGVGGVLSAPQLQVVDAAGTVVAQNSTWGDGPNASQIAATTQEVGAFALPAGSNDAAVLVTLAPGAYTVEITGAGGATGVALAEIYAVP